MTVYLIAQITISDREEYQKYEEGFMDVFLQYEGRLLSVDENPKVIEGEWNATRSVLMSFPSEATARNWLDSDEYQAIARHRHAAAHTNSIVALSLKDMMAQQAEDESETQQ